MGLYTLSTVKTFIYITLFHVSLCGESIYKYLCIYIFSRHYYIGTQLGRYSMFTLSLFLYLSYCK